MTKSKRFRCSHINGKWALYKDSEWIADCRDQAIAEALCELLNYVVAWN